MQSHTKIRRADFCDKIRGLMNTETTTDQSSLIPMSAEQFRAYQVELGNLTHGATASLLGLAEITVKRYATGRPIPDAVAVAIRALVLLHRMGKLEKLVGMA